MMATLINLVMNAAATGPEVRQSNGPVLEK
jgi:hypothetical protein